MRQHRQLRPGFTLVELLVAMALTMFIMMILSQAFVTSLDTFAGLKAIGDLQASLRSAGAIIQADLTAYHFEGSRRLRDADILTNRPRQGFFVVYQGSSPSLTPGNSAYVDEGYEAGFGPGTCAKAGVPTIVAGAVQNPVPVNYGGSGYSSASPPLVTISGGGGSGATALASVSAGGQVVGISVSNGGSNYSSSPQIIIAPPPAIVESYRAGNHVLYCTIKAIGNRPESVFSASLPAGPPTSPLATAQTNFFGQSTDALFQSPTGTLFFNSQWAEVCYFLMQTGTSDFPDTPGAVGGTPLYALYRGQYLLVPNPINVNQSALRVLSNQYKNVSCYNNPATTGPLTFNSPEDVTNPANRMFSPNTLTTAPYMLSPVKLNETPSPTNPLPSGCSQVLTNVVSCQVQVFTQQAGNQLPGPDFADPIGPPPALTGWAGGHNSQYFDSSSSNYNVLAVKVTLRIFDPTSKQTRQITIVQDM